MECVKLNVVCFIKNMKRESGSMAFSDHEVLFNIDIVCVLSMVLVICCSFVFVENEQILNENESKTLKCPQFDAAPCATAVMHYQ